MYRIAINLKDARYYQIATLGLLFVFQLIFSDFGSDLKVLSVTLFGAILGQYCAQKYFSLPVLDLKSPLITSLSLTLLLKTNFIWIYFLAALLAMASKFLIRIGNKHIFNPANIAIVALLLIAPYYVWISPGQWGSAVWFGFGLMCFAGLVLGHATRIDTALFFLTSYVGLLLGRALWLGDPLDIAMHQMQSGALLIFTFFMITDPKTTPDHRFGRFLFTFAVALIGFSLQFSFQIREGLFYALAIVCIIRPIIDWLLVHERFEWVTHKQKP